MKLKKIAVIIRGHKRTWDYTKKHMFDFFDQVADHVDYYVNFWKSFNPVFNEPKLQADFDSRNLVFFNVAPNAIEYDAFRGPPFLSKMCIPTLFERERTIRKYDLIFDTRPDVIFKLVSDPIIPEPWHIGTTSVVFDRSQRWSGLHDHAFIMDSTTNLIWAQRGSYTNIEENGHVKLLTWAEMNRLVPYTVPWFQSVIVRPSVFKFNHSENYFKQIHDPMSPTSIERDWQKATPIERFQMLIDGKVDPLEYTTQLGLTY